MTVIFLLHVFKWSVGINLIMKYCHIVRQRRDERIIWHWSAWVSCRAAMAAPSHAGRIKWPSVFESSSFLFTRVWLGGLVGWWGGAHAQNQGAQLFHVSKYKLSQGIRQQVPRSHLRGIRGDLEKIRRKIKASRVWEKRFPVSGRATWQGVMARNVPVGTD